MREIKLTKGFVAKVDDSDYEYLSQFCWHAKLYKGVPYAARSIYLPDAWQAGASSHTKTVLMHKELTGAGDEQDADHKDRDTLNNQSLNLRVCTRSQNCANQKIRSTNKSGFKGVNWKIWKYKTGNSGGCWAARISVGMKRIHIGYFSTAEEAAYAYDTVAQKHFGEFARLNFPNFVGVNHV